MPESPKIRILLADEDSLRRDGLAAVLVANANFEVVSGVPDGEAALDAIRGQRPEVAVVDLNLPKLHGIELVRRVRSEALGTKVIIVAGTADDEIVREVVRAGGDGYLLKNGPARHLIDAISYVRDGGQYFSPQLKRDGRERHLLEEPTRPVYYQEPDGQPTSEYDQGQDGADLDAERAQRIARGRRTRRPSRPVSDPSQFRDRIREEAPENLNDHDYEIMSMMADGIKPILDRLDEIDNRVAQMETGDVPVPTDPRGWLNNEFADTVRDARGGTDVAVIGRSVTDLESRLPELIEEAVTKRFHQMADKLQQEIEETHVRTLETFVKNIQVKLVQRVSALEQDMSRQAEAMSQLRDYSQRTEDNLSRLITGVDKLAQDLPRRLAASSEPQGDYEHQPEPPAHGQREQRPAPQTVRTSGRRSKNARKLKMFWAATGALGLLVAAGWTIVHFVASPPDKRGPATGAQATTRAAAEKSSPPDASADTKTKMQAAQESVDRKDYSVAEDIYKQVIKAEPGNVEALKALASVLYREDKIDESVAILDRLGKN